MLTILQGDTTDNIVVTLKEKTTLTNPYYLFVCEHITTKEQVKFIVNADLSLYPDRYNEFAVTVSNFTTTGQYIYKVYEQVSSTNTDPTGLNMVENGRLQFRDSTLFAFTKYSPVTTFKTYAG
jgi:hypothetical protein